MEKHENFFERLARERNITVEEMKQIISDRINKVFTILPRKSVNHGRLFLAKAIYQHRKNG